jgi:hypothetical protein
MGLDLFFGPRDYKASAKNLKGSSFIRLFVRFPDWVIQGLGVRLTLTGFHFLARFIAGWHPM